MNIVIFFSILYAVWRRCYGGLDLELWKRVFPKRGSALHRWFWRTVNLSLVFCVMFFLHDLSCLVSIYAALVMQFLFWDWTFGIYMGLGRHELPPAKPVIDEYEKQFFAPVLSWLIDNDSRYGEFYDYLGMFFRFTAPGLAMAFVPGFGLNMCLLGGIIATSYLIGIRMIEKHYSGFLSQNFAELSSGFFTGMFLVLF